MRKMLVVLSALMLAGCGAPKEEATEPTATTVPAEETPAATEEAPAEEAAAPAEGDGKAGAHLVGGSDHVVHEGPPAQLRLVSGQDDQVVVGSGDVCGVHARGGPGDVTGTFVVEVDTRAGNREVEEVLGVDCGHLC